MDAPKRTAMRDAFTDLQGMTMDCREMCRADASSIKAVPK
jgi:hypothetical protein